MAREDTRFTTPDDRPLLLIERTFHAPARAVWQALTEPDYIERWYGPRQYTTAVTELDLRPGGRYRFVNLEADGTEYGFHGEYIEVVPDKRLIYTWTYEGAPDELVLETDELEERDGETVLRASAEFPSMGSRDSNLQAGMLDGAAESYDRMDEVLAGMQAMTR